MTDLDPLKNTGVDAIFLAIDRRDVEKSDLSSSLAVLHRLLQDRETILKFRGRVRIALSGYDQDVRELYEISEVRNFWALLDSEFPFWFYFVDLESSTLSLIVLSLCRYSISADRNIIPNRGDFEDFVVKHFAALSWLFKEHNLDDKQGEILTAQIVKYFEQIGKPTRVH